MNFLTVRIEYILYAVTIFISSFLLFQVQPLLGKHLLPWFGGSPSVWITAMFFFMVVLAIGYLYALVLSFFSRAVSVMIHVSALLLAGAVMVQHAREWPSAITPLLEQMSISVTGAPVTAIFITLTLSVGLPLLVLSSTSSLLQFWYGTTTEREPFSLYAVSNTGSLAGLLSYPFVFEPFFSTYMQGELWSFGFILYGVCLAVVMGVVIMAGGRASVSAVEPAPSPTVSRFLVWTLLASVPVATMLAVTNYVSGYIAPIPFLWIIPLGLYLTSFIVSFRTGTRLPLFFTYAFVLIFTITTLVLLLINSAPIAVMLTFLFGALFLVCHLCHETLYQLRPSSEYLTRFYVALSFGGILGSVVILVSLLYVLPMPLEFPIIISIVAIVAGYQLLHDVDFKNTFTQLQPQRFFWLVVILVVGSLAAEVYGKSTDLIAVERNFFGYKAVYEQENEHGLHRVLVHGTTNHGYQFLDGPLTKIPVSYYGETAGVNLALTALRGEDDRPLRVAVAGLGSGALGAICREGDTFDFFEIDPDVIELATTHFTYTSDCADTTVQLGDARLLLEAQYSAGARGVYDFIILDAYADDMMPIHLMTAEAVAVYKELLADDGMLAIHISSRYLELGGVVAGLAKANAMTGRFYFDRSFPAYATASDWTLLAKHDTVFEAPTLAGVPSLTDFEPLFWTDTYSALFSVVRLW